MIMLGLCSWAPNRTSACSKGVSPWGSAVRQRIMACPRCINARCVDVRPFFEIYGTCRILGCHLANARPRGSNGSLTAVKELFSGLTTGARSIISSVSFKALTFGSQFAESLSTIAKLPLFSLPVEALAERAPGSESVSIISCSSPVSAEARV